MAIDPQDAAALTLLISPERLGKLTQLTGSVEAAIELHQETLKLGAAMMHVTATVEIALRNAICENLSHHFAVPNWLFQPPVPFQWRAIEQGNITKALDSARRAEYAKLSQAQKAALDSLAYPTGRPPGVSHLKRAKDRRRHIAVTEGKVIAELTFYLWKRLFSPDYEQTLWRTTLKRTFPDKTLSRATVADTLEHIYQSRNRLAHHEPVLHKRFTETMSAIEFVIQRLGTKTPDPNTALANLLAADIAEVSAKAAALHGKLASYRVGP
jgi:hypothetical protein